MRPHPDMQLALHRRQYLELEKLALGVFAPVRGFMSQKEFSSVVQDMHLTGGEPFPLPIVLDVTAEQARALESVARAELTFNGETVGELDVESIFDCDKREAAEKIYGTTDTRHPGVRGFFSLGTHFVGGPVRLHRRAGFDFSEDEWTPAETRAWFGKRGWKTIAGFQTRNVPHLGHEYLLRLALEQCEGLFIQPLVGRKKSGDFTTASVLASYRALIEGFLPSGRILLGVLSTAMRYAGPREAVFHAIIRRNYGCTHFIVGRDHAGVGDYYGKYAAHDLTREFDGRLGIEILRFAGPFHCARCGSIVTERTCPHEAAFPEAVRHISGTDMRGILLKGEGSDLMRPEIVRSVAGLALFIDEEETE